MEKYVFQDIPYFEQPLPFFGQKLPNISSFTKRPVRGEKVERRGLKSHVCTRKVLSTQRGCVHRKSVSKMVRSVGLGGGQEDLGSNPSPNSTWHSEDYENVHLFLGRASRD